MVTPRGSPIAPFPVDCRGSFQILFARNPEDRMNEEVRRSMAELEKRIVDLRRYL